VAVNKVLPFKIPKANKYGAIRTEAFGIVFDSKKEAKVYGDLRLLERAGEIDELRRQVKHALVVNGIAITSYTADFTFRDLKTGKHRVVDVKGDPTGKRRDFLICKRLMLALYDIEIEVW
jgi:hypothetical protein